MSKSVQLIACLLLSIALTSPLFARDSVRESQRSDWTTEISFESSLAPSDLKKCLVDKAYALKSEGLDISPVHQKTEFVILKDGTGELIHWGLNNANSIELQPSKTVTTVKIWGPIIAQAFLSKGDPLVPIRPMTYFQDCYSHGNVSAQTTELMPNALYRLDSKLPANAMADCVVDATLTQSYAKPRVRHDMRGVYQVDIMAGYKSKVPETLLIFNNGAGSTSLWRRIPQTSFGIKLRDPAGPFQREIAEKSHFTIQRLKLCADIAAGKAPPVVKVDPTQLASTVETYKQAILKRFETGEILMAEMPLRVLPTPKNAPARLVGDHVLAQIPLRAVAAAKIVSQSGKQIEYWPALMLFSPGEDRKFDEVKLSRRDRIAYCNEKSHAWSIKDQSNVIICYQDLDGDGAFEMQRSAFVSSRKSVVDTYFVSQPTVIFPLVYSIAEKIEIPTGFIEYQQFSNKSGFRFCSFYAPPSSKVQQRTYCYLESQLISTNDALKLSTYRIDRVIISTSTESRGSDPINLLESIPPDTIIGNISARDPILDFGAAPSWIQRYTQSLTGSDRIVMKSLIDVRGKSIAIKIGQTIFREVSTPGKMLQVETIGELQSSPKVDFSVYRLDEHLAEFWAPLDTGLYSPPRRFGCTWKEDQSLYELTRQICILADTTSGVAFLMKYPDLSYFLSYEFTKFVKPMTFKSSSISRDHFYEKEVVFVGVETDLKGGERAQIDIIRRVGGIVLTTATQRPKLKNGVGRFSIGSSDYFIERRKEGDYQISPPISSY